MSSLIVEQLPLLELLTKVKDRSRKKILEHSDLKLIKAIVECVYNVLKRNVLLKQKRVQRLKKYKKTLRNLANPKKSIKQKKKFIVQSGGSFLPILLQPIVSFLFDQLTNE